MPHRQEKRALHAEYMRAYNQSEKGKEQKRLYEQGEKGKATRRRYKREYNQSERGKEHHVEAQRRYR